jgi:two-component system cell cycle sensor histidine kinase/response regulator CckA
VQVEKLLRRLISENVALVTTLAPDVHRVQVDPASVEQVLVNLAVNARDAMPGGGRLTIETANVDMDDTFAGAHVPMPAGRYAMLSVGDTGVGMDEATRARIFEPFFTTKEQGKGTGLGLATVYGIVKQSGGYIWVSSEPGEGSVFRVYLPPAEEPDLGVGGFPSGTPAPAASDEAAPVEEKVVCSETILLVEDDDAVRALAREVLRLQGYVVLEAREGADALELSGLHPGPIHALVTDVVMPNMSGRELAERLSATRPDMKMLFMSGYMDHAVMQDDPAPDAAFLQKPFTPDVFARAVRTLLDKAP